MMNRVHYFSQADGNPSFRTVHSRKRILASCLAIFLSTGTPVVADDAPEKTAANQTTANEPTTSTVTPEQASALIDSLAAPTFAERERAMGEILSIGAAMAPYLRDAIGSTDDPELLLRAKQTLSQMTLDDFESRVEIFLSGSADSSEKAREWFPGWTEFEAAIGDSYVIRELFVEVMKAHPESPKSLTTNTADRMAVAEKVASSVQLGMLELHQPPSPADGVAILVPFIDPDVRLGGANELTLLRIFNRNFGELQRDPQKWQPVSRLLEMWILRSRIENRIDVLWYSMQWDLPVSGQLGMQTLDETTDVETLQTAFQSISRFRSREDAPKLVRWLSDERPAMTRMPVVLDQKQVIVKVADTALATIAILYSVPLRDLGMQSGELHPKVGFLVDSAGYTADQADVRADAIKKAISWCEGKAIPGRPRS